MSPTARSAGVVVVVVFGWCLLAHGLALLNDGIFWDGWLEWAAGRSGDWASLHQWWDDSALPAAGHFHHAIMASGSPLFLYRLLGFLGTVAPGLALAFIARRHVGLGPTEATLVGAVAVTHRMATTTVSLVGVLYLTSMLLFSIAAVLLFVALEQRWPWRLALRLLAGAVLMVSFTTQSMLVLAYPLLLGVVLADVRLASPGAPAWRTFLLSTVKHTPLALLPPLYYFGAKDLWETAGPIYVGYNTVDVKMETFFTLAEGYLDHGYVAPITDGLASPAPILLTLSLTAFVVAALRTQAQRASSSSSSSSPAGLSAALGLPGIAAFGIVAAVSVVAAAFPYIAVAKVPGMLPWTWRHALLAPVGVGAVAVALLALVRGRALVLRCVVAGVLVFVAVGQASASLQSHAVWLGRAAKDRGVIARLKAIGKPRAINVLWLRDDTPYPNNEGYRYYEWTGMFYEAWNKFGVVGLRDTGVVSARHLKRQSYYLNRRFNLYGRHGNLTIAARFAGTDFDDVGLAYARRRLWGDAAAYATSLVHVTIEKRDPPGGYYTAVKRLRGNPAKVPGWKSVSGAPAPDARRPPPPPPPVPGVLDVPDGPDGPDDGRD